MSRWRDENHITGKVYDLTQENMNKLIAEVERLKADNENMLKNWKEERNRYIKANDEYHDQLAEAREVIEFYGRNESWVTGGYISEIEEEDGKRARAWLNKNKAEG